MGMYDDLTCEYALPGEPKPTDINFQTKDFDCLLDHYMITKDGRLTKKNSEVQFHGMLRFYTYTEDDMWFEYEADFAAWDEEKNKRNQRKHGVSFETAELVFDDPLHVSRQDRIEDGQQRWQTIGTVGDVALLLVAHTWEDTESGGATCNQAREESL